MNIPNTVAGVLAFFFIFIVSCTKSPHPTSLNPTQTDSALFKVDYTWECNINGVFYDGSVDTSFAVIGIYAAPDTVIYCTATSSDKKGNFSFLSLTKNNLYFSDCNNAY